MKFSFLLLTKPILNKKDICERDYKRDNVSYDPFEGTFGFSAQ